MILVGDTEEEMGEKHKTHLVLGVLGLGSHVRQKGDVVHGDQSSVNLRLVREHIQTGGTQLATVEGLNQGFLIDNTTSSGVDEASTILHGVELGLAEALLGATVKGQVEGDDVGTGKELVQVVDVLAREFGSRGDRVSVVVNDLHVPSQTPLGNDRTDTTHTNDTDSLSLRVRSGLQSLLPFTSSSVDLGSVVLSQSGEDEEHGSGGGSVVNSSGSVGNLDSSSSGGGNVDLVVTSSVVADVLDRLREVSDQFSVKDADGVGVVIVSRWMNKK